MPCWYFDKSDLRKTPSIQDGVPIETEARYRREATRFIFDMGSKLGLSHDTLATAVVFFHRFYVFHSFKKFPRYITSTCCLFLAGKVEETPKKCRDLVKVARSLLPDAQFVQFGEDPREEVMTFEKILLQTIKFDLQVEHPYKFLVQYAKALKADKAKVENLVQMAWTFINDSFCTTLCLQWEPQIVAVAVMYLAGRLCKFEPQDWAYNRGRWWEQFIDDISMDLLEDICHQVLDLYSHQKPKGSSSKGKRERPKTPGDGEKSGEPTPKTARQDSKHGKSDGKPKSASGSKRSNPQTPSSQPKKHSQPPASSSGGGEVSRQDSTNTEVVAMETVETADSGAIETHNPSKSSAVPSQITTASASAHAEYQYQSFMAAGDMARQYSHSYTSSTMFPPGQAYGAVPTTPQTPTPPQHRPNYATPPPPTPPFPSPYTQPVPPVFLPRFPPVPGSFDQGQSTFPPTPPSFYPSAPSTATGVAPVRISGRRDQQSGNPWA